MRAILLGLAAIVLGACGTEPLEYEQAETAADALTPDTAPAETAPEVAPDTLPPAPVACVLTGLNFFEFACPGHPGCNRCRDEEPSGTGYLMGCLAPSGSLCIDFCEYCPPDPGPRS